MQFSVPLSDNIVQKAAQEIDCLYTAADCLIGFRQLQDTFQEEPVPDFWRHVQTAMMGSFVINFCKLFGVDCQDMYWKQLTLEQKAYRDRVYEITGLQYRTWMDYRQRMSEFHNRISVHLTPWHRLDAVPDFQPAFLLLCETHRWLRDVFTDLGLPFSGPMAEADYIERIVSETTDILKTCQGAGTQ